MLEFKEGKVVVIDDHHKLDNPLGKFFRNDRNKGKKFFSEGILYAYFMYKKEGIYSNRSLKERAITVSNDYFSDNDYYKKFEINDGFRDFKEYYLRSQYSVLERSILSIEEDIDDMVDRVRTIPSIRKIKIAIDVNIPAFKDSKEVVNHRTIEEVEVENYEGKQKVLDAISKSYTMLEKLKTQAKIKKKEQKNQAGQSLLESGAI